MLFVCQTLLMLPPLDFPLLLSSYSLSLLCFHYFLFWLLSHIPSGSSQGLGRNFRFNNLQAFTSKSLCSHLVNPFLFLDGFLCCLMAPGGQDGNPERAGLASSLTSPSPSLSPVGFSMITLNVRCASTATAVLLILIVSHVS